MREARACSQGHVAIQWFDQEDCPLCECIEHADSFERALRRRIGILNTQDGKESSSPEEGSQ